MEINDSFKIEFKKEQDFLTKSYPIYISNIGKRLWYAEDIYGERLGEFLKLPVELNHEFWTRDDETHSRIRANVLGHINDHSEKTRLSLATREDKDWRQADPEFYRLIVDRYGEGISKYKIDQTVSLVDSHGVFRVQRSCYLDQLGSNIFCDWPAPDGTSLRDLDTRDGGFPPFAESRMANTIGVAAMFFDKAGVPILRWRKQEDPSRRMAVMREGWHCTTSGVLTWQDFTTFSSNPTISSVIGGIERETENESGLFRIENGAQFFEVHLIAFARELKRAGKPQFFFAIHFPNHSAEEIINEIIVRPKPEGEEYAARKRKPLGRIFSLKPPRDASDFHIDRSLSIAGLNEATLQNSSHSIPFTFEGYANLFYAIKTKDTWR